MSLLDSLLKKGYFPKELPPCFNTKAFAECMRNNSTSIPSDFTSGKLTSRLCMHTLARAGSLRRNLAVINPVGFFPLAKCISDNWMEILIHLNMSDISKSIPDTKNCIRALVPQIKESGLVDFRAKYRASNLTVVKADIAHFYPSIYTHSIPWALHTKSVSKQKKRDLGLLGNKIDFLVRNCQDQQTMGIPIGPDTSLVIAEIILASVDQKLQEHEFMVDGFRYYDDYEFAVDSSSKASGLLNIIQTSLNDYELALNPSKTNVVNLPTELESHWIHEIRSFVFRSGKHQRTDILCFFDKLFKLINEYPTKHITKYALTRFYEAKFKMLIENNNWDLLQNLLLQTISVEPGGLPSLLRILLEQKDRGETINLDLISKALHNNIKANARLGNSSEIAWALWGAIILEIRLDDSIVDCLTSTNDSVIAILALEAESLNLLTSEIHKHPILQTHMDKDGLYGSQWLLSYEAAMAGWIPNLAIDSDEAFNFLKDNNVRFYTSLSNPLKSLTQSMTESTDPYHDVVDEDEDEF